MAYIGNKPVDLSSGNVFIQQFSGDGVNNIFVLDVVPPSINYTDLYIIGQYQNKNTYSIVGNILTCADAPPAITGLYPNIEIKVFEISPLSETSASLVSFSPNQYLVSTNVQAAINELASVSDDYGLITGGLTFTADYGSLT